MKIKHVIKVCIIFFCVQFSYGQVGIGTTSPDQSSVLEVSSTDKGLLFPRMTTVQRDAISNPANGLMIYNTDVQCLHINTGSPSSPNWNCLGSSGLEDLAINCDVNGFEGTYVNGIALMGTDKFTVTLTNNGTNDITLGFETDDLDLNGVNGITVSSVNPTSATIIAGGTQLVEYSLMGTPSAEGTLTGVWVKSDLICFRTASVLSGDATFTLPQTILVFSTNDGTINNQGIIDNSTNQLTVDIPYTSGVGSYNAYSGVYTMNNSGTGEGGDVNGFRLTYPAGIFSSSGIITATIEVEGDESFSIERQLLEIQETVATLDFQVNNVSKGNVNIDVLGAILDRNFADSNHKFVYQSVMAADGNRWLNNNLGANYANIYHAQFNPSQQATATNDRNAYGSLYQWGRYSDGHELITYTNSITANGVNGTTNVSVSSDTPGHNLFINGISDVNVDWRSPQNDNLWQGEAGINNPCPEGFRIPTETEFNNLITAEGINSSSTALNSSVAFNGFGLRNPSTVFSSSGVFYFWTADVNSFGAVNYRGFTNFESSVRSFGFHVRCIQD